MLTKTTSRNPEAIGASRRKFLGKIGGVAAITAFAVACQKDVNSSNQLSAGVADDALTRGSFGTGDTAILNYAYLLEQLEAAFYIMVTSHFYNGATDWEQKRLKQIRDHEIAHREFFKTALNKSGLPVMEFNFSSIDFSSRTSVLTASQTFEDTGVSAYNGVAYHIQNPDYLLTAGKIVSVEARHASYIRDLVKLNSFADRSVIDIAGLDLSSPPAVVLEAVKPYLTTSMSYKGLPM